jgi:hypothetical protein
MIRGGRPNLSIREAQALEVLVAEYQDVFETECGDHGRTDSLPQKRRPPYSPANMVFGRELRLPCDLMFGAPPGKEQSVTGYTADLVEQIHDIHHFDRQNLKVASDRMKARYDQLANSAGFKAGERVWLYRPNRKKGKSPKLQTCLEGPYNIITRINDVVYRIQRHPRAKMMVVHMHRLGGCSGRLALRREQCNSAPLPLVTR